MEHKTGIASQARQPHDLLGTLFGYSMAFLNDQMNGKVVDLLRVQATDHVLEIGFGPGKTIQQMAKLAVNGLVAGIDFSEVMVRQAQGRNKEAIRAGKVEIKRASVSEIPYKDKWFDKVCAVNTFQFWPAPEADLHEVWRVMKSGGLFVLAIRGQRPDGKADFNRLGFSAEQIQETLALLERAGFHETRTEVARVRFMTAVCLMAQKP